MHPHFSRYVPQYYVSIFQFHPESCVREIFNNLPLHLDHVILGHFPSVARLTTQRRLEIRFLQQRFILLRHHVVLNLCHEIHGHHHNNHQ